MSTTTGYTFAQWSEVSTMIAKAKSEEYSDFCHNSGIFQYHDHGYVLVVNGEKEGDTDDSILSQVNLNKVVNDALAKFPGAKIEVSWEGHWDWFEDNRAKKDGDYEPTMYYIDVPLFKN